MIKAALRNRRYQTALASFLKSDVSKPKVAPGSFYGEPMRFVCDLKASFSDEGRATNETLTKPERNWLQSLPKDPLEKIGWAAVGFRPGFVRVLSGFRPGFVRVS